MNATIVNDGRGKGFCDTRDVKERAVDQGKFVIGMDCKKCGERVYGRSYCNLDAAYLEALAARNNHCGGAK